VRTNGQSTELVTPSVKTHSSGLQIEIIGDERHSNVIRIACDGSLEIFKRGILKPVTTNKHSHL